MAKAHVQVLEHGEWTYPTVYKKDGQWYNKDTNELIRKDFIFWIN